MRQTNSLYRQHKENNSIKTRSLSIILATAVFASNTFAGENEVKVCAEKLPEDAQKILGAVTPKLEPGINARELVKSTVISMVRSGDIDRDKARNNAQAAGDCLKKLQD